MSMMNFVDSTKTQKSRYLEDEPSFSLQIKKAYFKVYFIEKNIFIAKVTFNVYFFLNFELHQGKSKGFSNKRMKVQVKRAFRNYFVSLKK